MFFRDSFLFSPLYLLDLAELKGIQMPCTILNLKSIFLGINVLFESCFNRFALYSFCT